MPFDPDTNSMTLANALFCAQASNVAYSATVSADVGAILGLTLVAQAVPNADDTFWFLAKDAKSHILAFRGTANPENVLQDGTFFQTGNPRGPGNVHRGFEQTLAALYPTIVAAMAASSVQNLCITGHSLGGAMASLCADWLDDDGTYSDPIVYTYGSPRVGDIPFSNDYAPKHYRFVNSGDVITRIPPPAILEGLLVKMYHHCGTQAYMGSTGLVLGGDLPIQLLSADQHRLIDYIAAIQSLIAAG